MYMPGRLRTASSPSRIWIEEAPYWFCDWLVSSWGIADMDYFLGNGYNKLAANKARSVNTRRGSALGAEILPDFLWSSVRCAHDHANAPVLSCAQRTLRKGPICRLLRSSAQPGSRPTQK